MNLDEGGGLCGAIFLGKGRGGWKNLYKVAAELEVNQNRAYWLLKKYGLL